MMEAGSPEAITYEFFHFVDEVFHGLNLDSAPVVGTYFVRFCQWAHRKD